MIKSLKFMVLKMPKRKYDQKLVSPARATFFDLPLYDVVVTVIAKYLSWYDLYSFSLCSKRCKDIADCMLAKGLDRVTIYGDGKYNLSPYRTIIQNSMRLRSVVLQHMDKLNNDICQKFLTNNLYLEEVKMYSCQAISSDGLLPLRSCTNLKKLSLSRMPIDQKFFKAFNEINKNLVEVNITDLNINAEELREFLAHQPHLEKITIALRDTNIKPCLVELPNLCPKLKYLDIHNAYYTSDVHDILKNLPDNCPKLTKICLSRDEFGYEDEILIHIINKNCEVALREPDGYDVQEETYVPTFDTESSQSNSSADPDDLVDSDGDELHFGYE
ncbi:uncharacterized protein LOC129797411 [Lutzomyia longipalpis]|uniref:uncharacterized protein LOC129797411 n=1 Tax=Lutzomyia longipalpis TaxID=7200 RepID=UPI0024842D18|nr:uncharacterized protein LOC129797411 [Lutzomyia longipalpis]